ncbi:lytic transglycosylase domain-containing protein [Herbaspirillum sp. HC18]|nr:lytic transglycosylase domain-containing protein [Herbaspirillum sp. HC18]
MHRCCLCVRMHALTIFQWSVQMNFSPVQRAWIEYYLGTVQRAASAGDPALRAHFEAEERQLELTLRAMGLDPNDIQDESPALHSAGAPGSSSGDILIQKVTNPPDMSHTTTYPPPSSQPEHSLSGGSYPSTGSTLGPGLPPQAGPYKQYIQDASKATGVPADLLAALIHDESRWDPNAGTVNGGNGLGDTGLVQMNDSTFADLQTRHPELQGKDKNDPATNILAGAFYLSEMRDLMKQKYGRDDWEIALRAYNSGPNGVDPNNLSNLPAGTGTANYVDKLMNYWMLIAEGGTLPA